MYVITVKFVIKPEHLEDFMPVMRRQAQDSLTNENGCLHFDVCQSTQDPSIVFLYEIYRSETDFTRHLQSEHFKGFAARTSPWVESKELESYIRDEISA